MNTEIKDKIILYHENDIIAKKATAVLTPLKTEIKSYCKDNAITKELVDNLVVSYTVQERPTTNDVKLLKKLKELGFVSAIKTIEVVDDVAVEQLIYEGKLTPIEIEDCVEVKEVEVLKITEKKNKKV